MALSRVPGDDFRGARGSNTGDDFHELWATRHAIRLLSREGGLTAVALEGLAAADESGEPKGTWDGVDCTLYYGGVDARADSVAIEQLKYSAANPQTPWTVARLVAGPRKNASVFAKLARAHAALGKQRSRLSPAQIVLVTNQPVDPVVIDAVARAASNPLQMPRTKPPNGASDELKLAYAAGLNAGEFHSFAAALRFEGGVGSRFLQEERVLKAISDWTDLEIQQTVTTLRQYIRNCMRPEAAGQIITRESVMLRFGASEEHALFPCPSEISLASGAVPRKQVKDAAELIRGCGHHVCLHGHGGVGKTTALQEIEASLPPGSVMIKYDCYGGGRYLDSGAFRHRTADAFVQLTNEMASSLRLPLLIGRNPGTDYPRAFSLRLERAANAIAAANPGALLVVAVDAADNSITAAQTRAPPEPSFVQDFVGLGSQAENVRFVVTARTGHLAELKLPPHYRKVKIGPFTPKETAQNVARLWNMSLAWTEDFHHLSGGNPRVQAYALQGNTVEPSVALNRLRPNGKSLDEVFRQQFEAAIKKGGAISELTRLCAGLIVLPRPVPLLDLSEVLGTSQAKLTDICADLAPGIRLRANVVGFADEDFEHFVRSEAKDALGEIQQRAADWLLSRMHADAYAALHVASVLIAAHRRRELLDLVEGEPAPQAVTDPVLRRVAELQRLRLAIRACREAVEPGRALRFVLIGAEGIKTDRALRELLLKNPAMAARFAYDPAGRLILGDPRQIANHGRLLFQRLAVDADRDDGIAVREGGRRLEAWLQARRARKSENGSRRDAWTITADDIAAQTEASLKLEGPSAALQLLSRWTPRRIALEVVRLLVPKLIAEGHVAKVEQLVGNGLVAEPWALFLICPLAIAGQPIDAALLARCLGRLTRRKLNVSTFFRRYDEGGSLHEYVLRSVINACEILTAQGEAESLVDQVLAAFLGEDLRRIDTRDTHEGAKLDILFRAYALQEARAGRTPSADAIYVPRSEPSPSEQRRPRHDRQYVEEHDKPLLELSRAVFPIYATTAESLVTKSSSADRITRLRHAVGNFANEEWRISRLYGSRALRARAAENLLILLTQGYDPNQLMTLAVSVHGAWQSGSESPDLAVVNTLSLCGGLHDRVLQDLVAAASATKNMRAGANKKSDQLVTFAKLILPISPADANSIFNDAIEVAGELDSEIAFQLRFLSRLVGRGMPEFTAPQVCAEGLGDVIHDAAIRLAGNEDFPWSESMSAMATLDAPAALAAAARWDDEETASLRDTLVPVIKKSLTSGLMTPGEATALDLFLERDHGLGRDACELSSELSRSKFQRVCEEAAWDTLVRYGHQRDADLVTLFRRHGVSGEWPVRVLQQHEYIDGLVSTASNVTGTATLEGGPQNPQSDFVNRPWDATTLIDPEALASEVTARQTLAREERQYLSVTAILAGARRQVIARNRLDHLRALADIKLKEGMACGADAVLETVDEWWQYPAIQNWCKTCLPDYIVCHLPRLAAGDDKLEPALARTGKSDRHLQDLILQGLESHVDNLGAEIAFALAGVVGIRLPASEAARLAAWYIDRLARRIPENDRNHPLAQERPVLMKVGVARFIFSYLGDVDLRMRWRATHALRRLAHLGEGAALDAVVGCYGRTEELAFRARGVPFYWLAARLWFVIAWDRIADEEPEVAAPCGQLLLGIALNDDLPHVLIRAFARDACEKLVRAGRLTLGEREAQALAAVNVSQLPRSPPGEHVRRGFEHNRQGERFWFNWADTLPYWYEPMLRCFSAVSGDVFLKIAEHWIVDVWGCTDDVSSHRSEPRRSKFPERNWRLSSNDHGSLPTLERYHTYLEWHAMWCATGQLLRTAALPERTDEYEWEKLDGRIREQKLGDPPLWATDLLCPLPLEVSYWVSSNQPLVEWIGDVHEGIFQGQLLPSSIPAYVVVNANVEIRATDRMESVSIGSALVSPGTAAALIRALQTMENAWDYKIPAEQEESHEIDTESYRLLGWLQDSHRGSGIDGEDPLRKYASVITVQPGTRVRRSCHLERPPDKSPIWQTAGADTPMFRYEVWGDSENDQDRYSSGLRVAGRRLLAHREQLAAFLDREALDLLVEVEVTRRDRNSRRRFDEEETEEKEARYDRLYLLRRNGALEIAEGCIGTWTPDRR